MPNLDSRPGEIQCELYTVQGTVARGHYYHHKYCPFDIGSIVEHMCCITLSACVISLVRLYVSVTVLNYFVY